MLLVVMKISKKFVRIVCFHHCEQFFSHSGESNSIKTTTGVYIRGIPLIPLSSKDLAAKKT